MRGGATRRAFSQPRIRETAPTRCGIGKVAEGSADLGHALSVATADARQRGHLRARARVHDHHGDRVTSAAAVAATSTSGAAVRAGLLLNARAGRGEEADSRTKCRSSAFAAGR